MGIDWLNPSDDVQNARHVGRNDMANEIENLVGEIKELQDIIDNVLSTADGVLIYPGCGVDRVWSIATNDGVPYSLGLHHLEYSDTEPTNEVMIEDSTGYCDFVEKCYSTNEAALEATIKATP